MADYKSMIKGTISAVGKKAKEYVESGALKDAYARGSTTAMCYANIAKLNLQINGELEEQKKVFTEIGRQYYDQNRDCAEGKFAVLFQELQAIDDRIEIMRTELEAAKAAVEASKSCKGNAYPQIAYYVDVEDNENE